MKPNATLCLIRLSAIGDVCHAISMVTRIRKQRPDISITWIIGKIEYAFAKGMDGVEFIVFDKSLGARATQHVKQTLKNKRFDVLCQMQLSFRANWLSRVIDADIRLGFDKQTSKEGHSLFINKRIPHLSQPHVLEGFHQFADTLGIPREKHLSWQIATSEDDANAVDKYVGAFERYIVICPAASKAERCWSPQRYAEIADFCNALGLDVVFCGGPGPLDKQLELRIVSLINSSALSLVGKTSLKELFLVLANAQLVIAPDSGPAHMASAAGTAVIGLYAHSNPRRTGPYLSLERVQNAYDQIIKEQKGLPWQDLPWGTRAKGQDLMSAISTQAVKLEIQRFLGIS